MAVQIRRWKDGNLLARYGQQLIHLQKLWDMKNYGVDSLTFADGSEVNMQERIDTCKEFILELEEEITRRGIIIPRRSSLAQNIRLVHKHYWDAKKSPWERFWGVLRRITI